MWTTSIETQYPLTARDPTGSHQGNPQSASTRFGMLGKSKNRADARRSNRRVNELFFPWNFLLRNADER